MITNRVLLFIFLLRSVWGFKNPSEDATELSDDISLRFADPAKLQDDLTIIDNWLYRSAQDNGTRITFEKLKEPEKLINQQLKTYVMFNGHPSLDSEEPFTNLRTALFQEGDVNVILNIIDWTRHNITFTDAVAISGALAQHIGKIFRTLRIPISNYHFFGHCVGADVAASVSEYLHLHEGLFIPRLTAFDPFVSARSKLHFAKNYIEFTDVYHAGIYNPAFPPIGDVDFYLNAGIVQPGCESITVPFQKSQCSHLRSIYLYSESIMTNVIGVEANFNESEHKLLIVPEPKFSPFGHKLDKSTTGTFYLLTANQAPYLMDYY